MDHAVAGIAGRAAQTEFGPGIEIGDRINDPSAEFMISRPGSETAMLFKRASGQAQMQRGIGCTQISGYDWRRSGIHRLAPLKFGHSSGLLLVPETNGEAREARRSDNLAGVEIVAPMRLKMRL